MSACWLISCGPGNDAVNDQRAQQQRHHGVAGNAQAHGRDEVALHRGMRRGLGAGDTLDRAVTETLRRLRDLLLGGVGHERGDGRSGARNQRAEAAEQGAADHRPERQLEIGLRREHVGDADLGVFHVDGFGIVDAVHELGDAEHAERQRDDFDAVEQFGDAEGEARLSGLDVRSDDADQKAENRHRDALERRSLGQRRAREQSDQHQRADFGGPEFERHLDQERRQENHLGDAERCADEGGDDGDAERGAALALLGQRKAVETRHRMRRMTWQIRAGSSRSRRHIGRRNRRPTASGSPAPAASRRSAAAGSRSSRRVPFPAARRPGCRPARRGSSTSGCAARARRQSRTRDR